MPWRRCLSAIWRRRAIVSIIVSPAMLAVPLLSRAQPDGTRPASGALRRVGVFTPGTREADEILGVPFYAEMRKLGWSEGQNVAYDRVYGADRMEMLPQLAAELVARQPELIFAVSPPTSRAAKQATSTIPIVFAAVVDPVAAGLVATFARPGGNVTGVTQTITESLAPKRLQVLREIIPGVQRVGLLGNPADPGSLADEAALTPVVTGLGMSMVTEKATNPAEFDAAIARLVESGVSAIIAASSIAVTRRARLVDMAHRARIPVVGLNFPMAQAGALFSFGPSLADQTRRAAHVVHKVLTGSRPAEIPVEAANVLELVVNQRSAKSLGIVIPQAVLLRAETVIE